MAQEQQDKRIDYIEIPVTDIEQAKQFYGGLFGWSLKDYGADYTSFDDGGMRGGFQKVETVSAGGPLIVLYAVDLKTMQEKIRAAGGTIVKDIFEFPGGRRFHFTDPSGNLLGL